MKLAHKEKQEKPKPRGQLHLDLSYFANSAIVFASFGASSVTRGD